jgi:hypothetical protein
MLQQPLERAEQAAGAFCAGFVLGWTGVFRAGVRFFLGQMPQVPPALHHLQAEHCRLAGVLPVHRAISSRLFGRYILLVLKPVSAAGV